MPPPIPDPDKRTLQWAGTRRKSPDHPTPREVVEALRRLSSESPALVAVFDARSVVTERQLLSAWAHLARSRARGESRLRDRSAELALYLAGDNQLPRALAKVGILADTEGFVLVAEKPRRIPDLLEAFGLVEAPSVFPSEPTEATLERLGIGAGERSAVPRSGWEGLLLERIALVDLDQSGSAAPAPKKP